MIDDSEIVKKMTAGCTKATAIVNNVLYLFALEIFLADLKQRIPFSIATDASNKANRNFFLVTVQYFTPQAGLCTRILDFFEYSNSTTEQLRRVLKQN